MTQIGRDEQSNKKILKSLMNRNPDPSAGRLWEEQLDHWSEGDVSPEEFARWAGAESIGWAARLLRRAGSSCRSSIDEGNASSNRSSYDYSASSFNTSDECPTSNVLPKLDLSLSHRWITGTPARNKSDSELVSSRRVHRKLPAVPDRNSVDDRHEKTQDATRRAASLPEALLASRSRRVDVEYLVNSEFWRPIQPAPPNTQEDKRRQATTLFGRHFQAERPSGCNAFALPPPPDEPEMPVVYSISESGNDFLRRSVGPLKVPVLMIDSHVLFLPK